MCFCIQPLAYYFLIFRNVLLEKFEQKNEFSKWILHHLKFSAFSMRESDAFQLIREAVKTVCIAKSFDASFGSEWLFLI